MPAIPSVEHPPSTDDTAAETFDIRENNDDTCPPLILLEIRNLSSSGARHFLHCIDASTIISDAIRTVQQILTPNGESTPSVRSITLVLRDFDGVAHTSGKDIDFEHKEIHLSTSYIGSLPADTDRIRLEITGVLIHEMVHVFQWNGRHCCNSGLIEGVADWVRLKAGLAPPHWKRRCEDCEWDSGYEITGYFLEWLNERLGEGTVVKMNQRLREEYDEDTFWKAVSGAEDVQTLWKDYALAFASKQPGEKASKVETLSTEKPGEREYSQHEKTDSKSPSNSPNPEKSESR